MQRLISLILILISTSTLFAQTIDKKIDKLIELQNEHPDYVTNSQKELMGDLIEYILQKNHNRKYSKYYVPYTFDTLTHRDKIFFYKTANITIDKKLFYWCYKNEKDKWDINSLVIDSLNNTRAAYRMRIISDNEQQIFVFKSDEAIFLLTNNQDKYAQRIDYDFNGLKDYDFVYVVSRVENGKIKWSSERNQNIFTNPTLDRLMQELKNIHGDYEKQQELLKLIETQTDSIKSRSYNNKSLYLTDFQVDDINNDSKIDYYWVAISNGKIVFYEIFNLVDSEWINISDTFDKNLFWNNNDIKKQIELTE